MDELINQLNKLDLAEQVSDDSIDLICDSLNKISISQTSEVKPEEITQVVTMVSKLPLSPNQIKKLDCFGLLVSKLIRKIKCYEFPDAYKVPNYVF